MGVIVAFSPDPGTWAEKFFLLRWLPFRPLARRVPRTRLAPAPQNLRCGLGLVRGKIRPRQGGANLLCYLLSPELLERR